MGSPTSSNLPTPIICGLERKDISFDSAVSGGAGGGFLIKSGAGHLVNFFVGAATGSPTVTVLDGISAGAAAKIIPAFSPVAGASYNVSFPFEDGAWMIITGHLTGTIGFD